MNIGVLALQGDVREHAHALQRLGASVAEVRRGADLTSIDGLIIPGGESTTIGKLSDWFGLTGPLAEAISGGLPTYGTCAGLIFLSAGLTEGSQTQLGVLDAIVERNAFGRQNESFESELTVKGLDTPFPAVFIRAPVVAWAGAEVDVLAEWEGNPVMLRSQKILASSFHPELTKDDRLHEMFLNMIEEG